MELKRVNRNLSLSDIHPPYVRAASNIGLSGKVYLDELPEGKKAIGTHSGTFHADEALAVSLLRAIPEYRDYVIVRTRNMDILNKCDIVVDVGSEYNPETLHFDHHQPTFQETFDENHTTKLSSAGLVYKHFGKQIINALSSHPLSDEEMTIVYRKVYNAFVEEIDGVDNGVNPWTGDSNYAVTTTLSRRVKFLYPSWTEPMSPQLESERFRLACGLMLGEFADRIHSQVDVLLPAREIVVKALDNASSIHPSCEILLLERECPFMDHLMELESERGIDGRTKFVLVQAKDGNWRIRAMNQEAGSFALRQKLLPNYCGLRNEELSTACGIPDCVFVHISGFMGINKTKEGAMQMAIQSLNQEQSA